MAGISGWMKQVIYLLIFLTMLLQILPNGNYKKYVKFFAGMIFVVTLLGPVVSLFANQSWESLLTEKLEKEFEWWGNLDDTQNITGKPEGELDFQGMEEKRDELYKEYASEMEEAD